MLPFIASAAGQDGAGAAEDVRRVKVTPELRDGALAALAVEVEFSGDADGETIVRLPASRVGRGGSALDTIADFEISNATLSRAPAADRPAERVLAHRPGAPLTIRYRVTQKFSTQFATVVQPTHFSALGVAIFPEIEERENFRYGFSWGAVPADWSVASDLEHGPARRPGDDLYASTLVGGSDLRIGEQLLGSGRFRIAMHSETGVDPDAFAATAIRIARTANTLWQERGIDYLVTVNAVNNPRGRVYSGLSLTDGYTLYLSPNPDRLPLLQTVAHEYLHNWVSKRLGDLGRTWFREGFTDYFARLVNLRAATYSSQDFAASWNAVLLRYAQSRYRAMPVAEAEAKAAEGDDDVQNAESDRGSLMALLLDYRLRRATRGRVTLARVLVEVKKEFDRGIGEGLGHDRMVRKARQLAGVDLQPDINRYLIRGEEIRLPADLFAGCAEVATITLPTFELGFPARPGEPLQGVDPASAAYAAGLRDNMILVRREAGSMGDPRVEMAYRVRDGDQERVIRFRPAGRATMVVQEMRLRSVTPRAAARCAGLMGGRAAS